MLSQDKIKASLFESVNDPDVEGDMMVGEESNSLDNPRNDSNVKVGVIQLRQTIDP